MFRSPSARSSTRSGFTRSSDGDTTLPKHPSSTPPLDCVFTLYTTEKKYKHKTILYGEWIEFVSLSYNGFFPGLVLEFVSLTTAKRTDHNNRQRKTEVCKDWTRGQGRHKAPPVLLQRQRLSYSTKSNSDTHQKHSSKKNCHLLIYFSSVCRNQDQYENRNFEDSWEFEQPTA